jgi:hypothetical protein
MILLIHTHTHTHTHIHGVVNGGLSNLIQLLKMSEYFPFSSSTIITISSSFRTSSKNGHPFIYSAAIVVSKRGLKYKVATVILLLGI